MKDLRALLTKFAENEDEDITPLINRKPNGPPAINLMPSEQAVEGFAEGVGPTMQTSDGSDGMAPMRDPNRYGDPNAPMLAGLGDGTQAPVGENAYPQGNGMGSDIGSDAMAVRPRTVAAQPPGLDGSPPMTLGNGNPTLNDDIATAQQNYRGALAAPIQKQDKWKDILAYIAQGADAAFNPGQGRKIEGYGKIKHDRNVRNSEELLGSLQKQRGIDTDDAFRKAQTEAAIQRPIIAGQEAQRKRIKDAADYEIKTKTLDWKKEDRDKYYDLEDVKIKARERHDIATERAAESRQKELERHNKETEKQGDRRIEQGDRRLGASDANRTQRRDLFLQGLQQKIQADKTKGQFDKMKYAQQVDADFNAGTMDKETYDAIVTMLNQP